MGCAARKEPVLPSLLGRWLARSNESGLAGPGEAPASPQPQTARKRRSRRRRLLGVSGGAGAVPGESR
eukprot:11531292-Alexandrium_andersonii.AAC.1